MSEQQLREKIEGLIWDVVDWVHHEENPGLTNEGVYPSDAIGLILTAIKEGIGKCPCCGGSGMLYTFEYETPKATDTRPSQGKTITRQCTDCGGKGWVMK